MGEPTKFIKHEIVHCARCGVLIECKANAFSKCQCSVVNLTVQEVEYISELYDTCLCAACLSVLKEAFQAAYNPINP